MPRRLDSDASFSAEIPRLSRGGPASVHLKVKPPLEICAYLVHRGEVREVVALALHDERPGLEYLRELRRSNPKGYQILAGQITHLCNAPAIRSKPTFKLLDAIRQLYEFRTRSGLRPPASGCTAFWRAKRWCSSPTAGKRTPPESSSATSNAPNPSKTISTA